MIFSIKDKVIFWLQLITPPSTSEGVVAFQDPFSLIYSVRRDFTPDFAIGCVIFFFPLPKGFLHWV